VYREFRPEKRLAPFVECGWVRSSSAAPQMRVLPDGCVDIFVTAQGELMIAGPAKAFVDVPAGEHDVLAGLRLRPGAAAAVIGAPASEFTDMWSSLDSAFGTGGSTLTERLVSAAPRERVALMAEAVAEQFADTEPVVDRAVVWAVDVLRSQPDCRISALAAGVGLSERQLRRRFEAAVGYGPKRLGRVFRLQRLLDLLHTGHGRTEWAQLAAVAGYTDQSHMINECRALAGGPPTTLASRAMS
jgi:AraC-like DNA-binding protein